MYGDKFLKLDRVNYKSSKNYGRVMKHLQGDAVIIEEPSLRRILKLRFTTETRKKILQAGLALE